MKKKVVPKLRQEVKVTVAIVTSDDIKIYHTGKFQDFAARYIIKLHIQLVHFYQGCFLVQRQKNKVLKLWKVYIQKLSYGLLDMVKSR